MRHTSIFDDPRLAGLSPVGEPNLQRGVVALYQAARCVQVLSAADPIDLGLSRVLITVARLRAARLSAIAAENHIDLSTASRHVDALVKLGLVAKATDPDDARACLVELTDGGRDVVAKILSNRTKAMESALLDWSVEDQQLLVGLLLRLGEGLDDQISAQRRSNHE